jgi:hypothetical protein
MFVQNDYRAEISGKRFPTIAATQLKNLEDEDDDEYENEAFSMSSIKRNGGRVWVIDVPAPL